MSNYINYILYHSTSGSDVDPHLPRPCDWCSMASVPAWNRYGTSRDQQLRALALVEKARGLEKHLVWLRGGGVASPYPQHASGSGGVASAAAPPPPPPPCRADQGCDPEQAAYYGTKERSDSCLGNKTAGWKRPERRSADAGKPVRTYLSAQGTQFHGLSKRSLSPSPDRRGARPKMGARSSSHGPLRPVWTKKRKEWPINIMIFSHCNKDCCWKSTTPSPRLEATHQIDCRYGYNAAMKDTEHDGRHHEIQTNMLNAAPVDGVDFSEVCSKVKRHLAKNVGQKDCLIGLWTVGGRNRAVAVAELLFAIMSWDQYETGQSPGGETFELELEHTALINHELHHTGCAGCEKSKMGVTTENFAAAYEVWEKAKFTP
jgi:hypothetical protein